MSTQLTEADTLKLAELDIRDAAGRLTDSRERLLWKALKAGGSPVRARSLGVRVVASHAYKSFAAEQLNANANVPLSEDVLLAQMNSGADVKTLLAGVSDTGAGAFITSQPGGYVAQPQRRLRILDLVRVFDTDVDAIEFARQTAFTNTAAAVAEATSITTGAKPEATIAFEKVTAPVATYATWAPATRQALSDVGEMRGLIDGQLNYATRRALEEAVVAAMVAGAGATQAKGADTLATATLKLLTTLRNADVEPTAALLNPADYEVLRWP